METLFEGLSVWPWNKQVILGAPKIMYVEGITLVNFSKRYSGTRLFIVLNNKDFNCFSLLPARFLLLLLLLFFVGIFFLFPPFALKHFNLLYNTSSTR